MYRSERWRRRLEVHNCCKYLADNWVLTSSWIVRNGGILWRHLLRPFIVSRSRNWWIAQLWGIHLNIVLEIILETCFTTIMFKVLLGYPFSTMFTYTYPHSWNSVNLSTRETNRAISLYEDNISRSTTKVNDHLNFMIIVVVKC